MSKSNIEWTDATWNPVAGCRRISPGCGGARGVGGCYAEKIAMRFSQAPGKAGDRFKLVVRTDEHGKPTGWNGRFVEIPEKLADPLKTKKPTTFFVNSMSDLFGEGVSDEYIAAVFGVMAACPQHRFQVLTKRAERMAAWFEWITDDAARFDLGALSRVVDPRICRAARATAERLPKAPLRQMATTWPLPNVWIGVSVEDQRRADERIPHLLRVPAAVRFLSCEPLLSALYIETFLSARICTAECAADPMGCDHHDSQPAIGWCIVGGESGSSARPMHPSWARSLRDQCAATSVPFFFKQWGAWQNGSTYLDDKAKKLSPKRAAEINRVVLTNGDAVVGILPEIDKYIRAKDITSGEYMRMHPTAMALVGKKAAGAVLDGRMHREWPVTP